MEDEIIISEEDMELLYELVERWSETAQSKRKVGNDMLMEPYSTDQNAWPLIYEGGAYSSCVHDLDWVLRYIEMGDE